jgi:hypothetical protein
MNIQLINLGTVPNDRTGDSIRAGGQKINDNAQELFFFSAARHRQSSLVYRTTDGQPDFLEFSGVDVSILGPFVGSIAGMNDGRGERNLPIFIQGTVANAWTAQSDGDTWLFISSTPNTGVVGYGTAVIEPANQQSAPSAVVGQYWYDDLEGSVKTWSGSEWVQVYVLFIAQVTAVAGNITTLNYLLDNDETLMARAEATKAAIVLG